MFTHRRTTATVTDGLGMTARSAGRRRVETARPTKVRSVEDGVPGTVARGVTRYKVETARAIEVQLVPATTAEWSARLAQEAEDAGGRLNKQSGKRI
jgi:hypothetical protein